MELSLERKLYFAAVGTKVNAQFFESIRTRKNVRTFIYGECDYSDKDITKLEFFQYKELPSENNGYKSIDEDYFCLYVIDKEALWSGCIDRISGSTTLTNSIVHRVVGRISTFIDLLTTNGYMHGFIDDKYHEWIKTLDAEALIKIRLTLGSDCCYLAVDNGDGYEVHMCNFQTIIDNQNWFCGYLALKDYSSTEKGFSKNG